MRVSSSTIESAYFDFESDLCSNSGAGRLGWWTFMKLTLMKKGWSGCFAASSRKFRPDCSTYLSRKGMPTTPFSGVSTYSPLTFQSCLAFSPALPESEPLVTFVEHLPQLRVHVGEPLRVAVGVRVQVVQERVLHHVVALGVGQRVVGLTQMPLAGEVGLVARGLEDGGQGPLRLRQPAALALEGHRRHAAAVRDASGLHRRAPRRAAGLRVEREEGHPLVRHAVEGGRGHSAPFAASIGTEVPIAGVVRHDQQDVRLRRGEGEAREEGQQECNERCGQPRLTSVHLDLQVGVSRRKRAQPGAARTRARRPVVGIAQMSRERRSVGRDPRSLCIMLSTCERASTATSMAPDPTVPRNSIRGLPLSVLIPCRCPVRRLAEVRNLPGYARPRMRHSPQ